MKKEDIRFVVFFIVIVLLSMFYLYQETFAKYKKESTGIVRNNIANWNIKVNNETIINKQTLTNSITPTFNPDIHVKPDMLAPGVSGYFDVIIDATDADVDFTTTISIDFLNTDNLTDYRINSYEINDSGTPVTYNSSIGIDIPRNTASTKIRFYAEWNDGAGSTMTNTQDTNYSINNSTMDVTINLNFVQKRSSV